MKRYGYVLSFLIGVLIVSLIILLNLSKPIEHSEEELEVDINATNEEYESNIGESAKHLDNELFPNNVTSEQLDESLISEKNSVVFFYSPNCPYCKSAAPNLIEAATNVGVEVLYVDITQYPEVVTEYGITQVPTLTIFEEGIIKPSIPGTETNEKLQNPKIGTDTIEIYTEFMSAYLEI